MIIVGSHFNNVVFICGTNLNINTISNQKLNIFRLTKDAKLE